MENYGLLYFLMPFNLCHFLVLLFGTATAALAVCQIAWRRSRNHGPLLIGLIEAMAYGVLFLGSVVSAINAVLAGLAIQIHRKRHN